MLLLVEVSCVHSVCNKGIEFSFVISNVPQHNAEQPEGDPKYPISLRKYSSNSCSSNSFLIMFNIFTDSAAATSSSLGIDANFSGAAVLHSLLPSYNVYSHFHPQH